MLELGWKGGEDDAHVSVDLAQTGGVIYAQPVGGRERWASKGPALIDDLVSSCTHTQTLSIPMSDGAHWQAYWQKPARFDKWTHTHGESSSFHNLKSFTFMHPHKLRCWKPKTDTVMHAGLTCRHAKLCVCTLLDKIHKHKLGRAFLLCLCMYPSVSVCI
ncbi:hypothetical protein ILYODFUR_020802 [Ilyodon furcidens]|uniref:Uncharacterized protein n=1 Tax=Ilyodon furcidens TaxID=33524 RepID=A0ABV0UI55_9TELE